MTNKNKLRQLVTIIENLMSVDGNEWLVEELLKSIARVSTVDQIAQHSIIQNINEYCIETNISTQAQAFYKNFPISDIKPQLIDDYKKMEHERRRDDFENFCLCLYQQIENITNYLFDKKIFPKWENYKNKLAIKTEYDLQAKKYKFPAQGGVSIEELIWQKSNPSTWFANRKFRAVLFFYYFGGNLIRDDFKFNSLHFTQDELYQVRNQNHRGGFKSNYQNNILNKIDQNPTRYYFKFHGFLQDFIENIESNLSKSKSQTSNKTHKKKGENKRVSNTLGDNSTVLQRLKNEMNKN